MDFLFINLLGFFKPCEDYSPHTVYTYTVIHLVHINTPSHKFKFCGFLLIWISICMLLGSINRHTAQIKSNQIKQTYSNDCSLCDDGCQCNSSCKTDVIIVSIDFFIWNLKCIYTAISTHWPVFLGGVVLLPESECSLHYSPLKYFCEGFQTSVYLLGLL